MVTGRLVNVLFMMPSPSFARRFLPSSVFCNSGIIVYNHPIFVNPSEIKKFIPLTLCLREAFPSPAFPSFLPDPAHGIATVPVPVRLSDAAPFPTKVLLPR